MNRIALIPLLAPVLFAQVFEVASVRVSPPRSGEAQYVKMNIDAARASYTNVTLRLLISIAFEIGDNRITGGEAWMDSTKYDVDAKLPPGAGKQQIPQMLQTLLTERFGLAVHKASKTMPAYDLVVAKNGPKLKSAAPDGSNYILKSKIVGPQLSMGALADILSRREGRHRFPRHRPRRQNALRKLTKATAQNAGDKNFRPLFPLFSTKPPNSKLLLQNPV